MTKKPNETKTGKATAETAAASEETKRPVRIYAVTGKSGSGKSRLAILLAEKLGCERIDIDAVGHMALRNAVIIDRIRRAYGDGVLNADGSVNRRAVGRIVFESDERMAEYIDITWTYMCGVLDEILARTEGPVVFEWVRLPISGPYWEAADPKILVTAATEERKKAVLERDGISGDYFDQRDTQSLDYDRYAYDLTIENDYRPETLERAAERIIRFAGDVTASAGLG